MVDELDEISSPSTYSRDAVLFGAGQDPRGVFVIRNGRVKLSTSSSKGKSILVRVAEAGEMLGLPSSISGKPHELTAEALEPSKPTLFLGRLSCSFSATVAKQP
jgi:CRP/FNR family transcriptional regulator, cyclic AMP receptor protein